MAVSNPPPARKIKRIILAEDEAVQRRFAEAALQSAGYAVDSVIDGFKCIEALGKGLPDLLLLDVNMPGLNGMQLIEMMAQSGQVKEVPVVMLTGERDLDVVVKCVKLGAADYVVKPADAKDLLRRVAELTFQITLSECRDLSVNLRLKDDRLALEIAKQSGRQVEAYATTYAGHTLCFALSKDLAPWVLAKMSDADFATKVEVFIKRQNWRKVWPK